MRPLRGELLLEAWERGSVEAVPDRALAALSVACGAGLTELAALSLAECDLELLRLRRITFGDALRGVVPCGSCATQLEFEVSVASMLERLQALRPAKEAAWTAGGVHFRMRPVTTRDLTRVASARDARRRLLALCTSVDGADAESALDAHERDAVEHFNLLNQDAETRFTLPCTACGATDHVELDVGRFLWAEVRHAALTLLREIHELASAYGWSEREILAMPAARRACYLEMVRT